MNFHFGVVTIFLILNVISAQSTGNGSSKKKRTSSKDQLSLDVATDSSIQSFINRRSIQNSFLQKSNSNRNRSSLSNNFTSQTSDLVSSDDDFNSFLDNNNNTILNPIKIDTTNGSELNTPAPDNDFISHVPTSSKIHPSVSSSLTDLLSSKTSPVKRISELSPEVQVGEIPHMVALGTLASSNEFFVWCDGTLISHSWVLTAAHCTYGLSGSPNAVKMGINKLSDQEGVTILIKRMIKHPDYQLPAMYADIALVQLMNAVTFSTVIRPACLYQQNDNVPRKAWISGWGVIDFARESSDHLYKTPLDVLDNLICTTQHNFTDTITQELGLPDGVRPSMICGSDLNGLNWTKHYCQGDTGGPLQVYPEDECLFQVIGIRSFDVCGLYQIPGVYIRVSYYLSWIEDIVWPQEQ